MYTAGLVSASVVRKPLIKFAQRIGHRGDDHDLDSSFHPLLPGSVDRRLVAFQCLQRVTYCGR